MSMNTLQRQVARLVTLRKLERRDAQLRADVDVQLDEIQRVVNSMRPLSYVSPQPERNLKP